MPRTKKNEEVVEETTTNEIDLTKVDDLSAEQQVTETEEIPDPVVEAEMFEDDEVPAVKETKKAKKTSAKENEEKTPEVHKELGIETDPMVADSLNQATLDEIETSNWTEITGFKKNKSLVWGILTSVQIGLSENAPNGLYAIVTMPKYPDMQVFIHEDDYWMENQIFGSAYESMTKEQKEEKRKRTMEFQIGSRIPMFIKEAKRRRTNDEYDVWQTPYTYAIQGDRKSAMHFYQKFWFFSKDTKEKINKNDTYFANVLQTRTNGVKVECCGVESYISAYELTGRSVVTDCTNCYINGKKIVNGSKISVKIQKCYIHHKGDAIIGKNGLPTGKKEKEDWVYLSVSGRLFDRGFTPKAIKTMPVGSVQMGYVSSYNKNSHIYSINLSNGVLASVHESRLLGSRKLDRNDRVLVTVEEKLDTYVRGRARKL